MVAVIRTGGTPTRADFHRAITARSDCWYSACLKITRNPDIAADAVQDALLSAWSKRHQFDDGARLETWIHRIAINAALMQLRKRKSGTFESLETEIADDGRRPDSALEDFELGNSLSSALASLTEIERICFVLKHLEEWRAREIATQLDIPEGRVKQAVFRAVKKLRIRMQTLKSRDDD